MRQFLVLIVLCTLTGCPSKSPSPNADDADTQFDRDKSLFATIPSSKALKLYEGLPHQMLRAQGITG